MKKTIQALLDKKKRFGKLNQLGFYNNLSDEVFLKKAFKINLGYDLNLEHPSTFNEKLQWLKLYDRHPEYTTMVDKYKVREYIAEKLGEEYLIPLLGVWDDPENIDFSTLPNQFVLKCNHNSGIGLCICRDKNKLDIAKVKGKLKRGLQEDYYKLWREWPYKDVPRKIIAEQYMENTSLYVQQGIQEERNLTDYKFFCFNGKPKFMYVSKDKARQAYTDFYDMDGTKLDMHMKDPASPDGYKLPVNFEKMKGFSRLLSKGIPFLRVDFYEIDGRIYFGELTFYHNAGFTPVKPDYWNKTLGDWILLPSKE